MDFSLLTKFIVQHPTSFIKTSNLVDGKRPHYLNVSQKKREQNEKEEEDDDDNNGNGDGGEPYEEKRANKNQSEKGEPNENAPGAKAFKRIE